MLGRTNTGGGGSGGLNFKVICNPQPATAKENTIWIDTDRINNTHFSATQPENMADYDVWISTGTSSVVAFSATKKNPIMVYPVSAKQYIGGACVDKTVEIYQGGEWIPFRQYLYRAGDEYKDVTGGWSTSGWSIPGVSSPAQLSKSSDHMTLGGSNYGVGGANNKINLVGHSKLKVIGKTTSPGANSYVGIFTAKAHGSAVAQAGFQSNKGEIEINLASYQGAYYVGFVSQLDASNTIYEVWLE